MAENEWVDIDGLVIPTFGDCIVARDLGLLLSGSRQRGSDRLVPGTAGVIANERRETVTDLAFPVIVKGLEGFDGTPHPDPRTGLALNIAHLRKFAGDPTGVGDGTRTATLHWQALTELEKPVHVEGFEVVASRGPLVINGVLQFSFPEGLFDLASLA